MLTEKFRYDDFLAISALNLLSSLVGLGAQLLEYCNIFRLRWENLIEGCMMCHENRTTLIEKERCLTSVGAKNNNMSTMAQIIGAMAQSIMNNDDD